MFAFTLDPTYGEFVLTHDNIMMPKTGKIYSFNEGNYDLWDEKLKNYLDHLRQPGSNGKPYSGRYIGCLVGEIHRMLLCGGIYGNPNNKNSKNGNLRLLYECAPMSYIVEKAGGKAIDGIQRILDITPVEVIQTLYSITICLKSQLIIHKDMTSDHSVCLVGSPANTNFYWKLRRN